MTTTPLTPAQQFSLATRVVGRRAEALAYAEAIKEAEATGYFDNADDTPVEVDPAALDAWLAYMERAEPFETSEVE